MSKPVLKQASLDTLMRCLIDFRRQPGDYINVFLATYRLFTSADVVVAELRQGYRHWKSERQLAFDELSSIRSSIHSSSSGIQRFTPGRRSTPHRSSMLGTSPGQTHRQRPSTLSQSLSQTTKPVTGFASTASPVQSIHSLPIKSYNSQVSSGVRQSKHQLVNKSELDRQSSVSSSPRRVALQHQISKQMSSEWSETDEIHAFETLLGLSDDESQFEVEALDNKQADSCKRRTTSTSETSSNIEGDDEFCPWLPPGLFRNSNIGNSMTSIGSGSLAGSPATSTILDNRIVNPGTIVVNVGLNRRRISSAVATQAFARATAGVGALDLEVGRLQKETEKQLKVDASLQAAQCLNIFNVIRHWSIMYPEDFAEETTGETTSVGSAILELLNEMSCDDISFSKYENDAINKLIEEIRQRQHHSKIGNGSVAYSPNDTVRSWLIEKMVGPSGEPPSASDGTSRISLLSFDNISTGELAEQMTFIDSTLFRNVKLNELMNQSWSKHDKENKAPTVTAITSHFNHMSSLVVTNILSQPSSGERATIIKKWVQVALTLCSQSNFNGALQIVSGLNASPVYRLKKTWNKLSKQSKQNLEKLNSLLSSENRYKQLRQHLRQQDPPCVPYLGMYLQDLTLIDEGCATFISNADNIARLVNFSKMKMIHQTISEIQALQSVGYNIAVRQQTIETILDRSLALDDDAAYKLSLVVEPRQQKQADH